MKKLFALLGVTLVLASCGADSEPVPPQMNANIGVSPAGITPRVGVNTALGPIGVRVGL